VPKVKNTSQRGVRTRYFGQFLLRYFIFKKTWNRDLDLFIKK